LYDLGVNVRAKTRRRNRLNVGKMLQKLDKRFHLVMIQEHFEESLVLLKNLTGWNYRHFAVTPKNVRKTRQNTSLEIIQELKDFLVFEYDLYNHFSRKFRAIVDEFGRERMRREVHHLKRTQKRSFGECERLCGPKAKAQCVYDIKENTLTDCPCHKFDFCTNCQMMHVESDLTLSAWAKCIQEYRLNYKYRIRR